MNNINSAFDPISWPVDNVLVMQTTRQHPTKSSQSVSAYGAFNLGAHVGDVLTTVKQNRQELASFFPKNTKIQWLDQVHGFKVIHVESVMNNAIQADAAITKTKNVVLAVMTADCLPILLSNETGTEIAVIHGGWRSLAANIIDHTLAQMSSKNNTIHAWLGPCIGPKHFEVGDEVRQAFSLLAPDLNGCFQPNDKQKTYADISNIARRMLEYADIKSINCSGKCAFSDSERYYSYRRDHHTGRMASLICIP